MCSLTTGDVVSGSAKLQLQSALKRYRLKVTTPQLPDTSSMT